MNSQAPYWSRRLERAVWALSLEPQAQVQLFPDFVCVADELALEFEESLQGALSTDLVSDPTTREAIADLDQHLERMSGEGNGHLWTSSALARRPEWEIVRNLARRARRAAGWLSDFSGPEDSIYVGPP